jgi:hypothetical protein
MTQPRRRETPEFLFERRPDVEANHDWLLAGILTIDAPRKPLPPAKRHQRQVNAILKELIDAAQDDSLPAGGLIIGWQSERAAIECDAAEFDDGATAEWRERSLTFLVRVTVGEDGHVRGEVRIPLEAEDKRPTLH